MTVTKENKRTRSSQKFWIEIKGKLYARLQYKTENGKYKVKYKPITDKRTARTAVDEMRRELEVHGEETLHADKLKFSDLADRYVKVKLVSAEYSNGVKIAGRRSLMPVRSAIKPLMEHFGNRVLRTIKASDIEAYKHMRLKTPLGNGSTRKVAGVNRELELLRAMFNFAIQNQWLIMNPFTLTKGIISKAAEVERDRILSFEEERRLLEVCVDRRSHLRPLLICALDTAMRRGEIFKMKWNDVNFKTGEIHIPQTNTKTEEARTVGVTDRLREEFEKLWEVSSKNGDALVFGITTTVKTAFASACKEAGISDFRFHDCRHTATTRMIASGSPHTEVMKITGHSQLKTFLRYLNITTETANKVANRLGDYLLQSQVEISDTSNFSN